MSNDNAILDELELMDDELIDSFDFGELQEKLQMQLEEELSDVSFMEEERDKIGNPDALGSVILNEIWNQFGNQVGLDMTNETLIQQYEREHPETYKEVGKKVMQDERYKTANDEMKKKQKEGTLKDEYTNKEIKQSEKANLDHTVSRKEIYENKRRRQANIATEDLANKKENLNPTNEALNKSKGAKSVDEMIETREKREQELKKQNERANKKIDESNKSETEKRLEKEKNNKRLQDKLDADDEMMKKADKRARQAINKDIAKGVAKETAKKAGKDAMKQMVVSALFMLLKEVMNGFVRFIKSQAKSFEKFLEEMKIAIKAFFQKITDVLNAGVSSVVGTIVNEIFGPIVSTFKKLASLIKQGVSSIMDAVRYLKDEQNKNKPFSIKVAQVGKIVTSGIVAGGAIFLGEAFEGLLLNVPGMQIELPLLGTLANVIGMFLASLVSGIIGAIIINLIDKYIANKQKQDAQESIITKQNSILATQNQIQIVNEVLAEKAKITSMNDISDRHREAESVMKAAYENIMEDFVEDFSTKKDGVMDVEDILVNQEIDNASNDLDDLINGL